MVTGATMQAAVYVGDGALSVQDVPVPSVGAHDALIEVSHCGVCGTDLHLVLENRARPGSILGHEWAGTLVDVGAEVQGWDLGARVVAGPTGGCGSCRACRRGRPSVCLRREVPDFLAFRGAFSRLVTVPATQLLTIPDGLTTRVAALTEPTAIALHTVNLGGAGPDDRVLITGGGPVGLLTLAVLLSRGVTDVTVVEPSPLRRRRAADIGARDVIAPEALPEGPMGRPVDAPFTVAFECSGHAGAAAAALDQLDYAGTLVFVGTGHELPRINHNRMIILELTIVGAFNYDDDGFSHALALLASGSMPIDLLIEPVDVTLTGLSAAMGALAKGEIAGKVLVRPEVSP